MLSTPSQTSCPFNTSLPDVPPLVSVIVVQQRTFCVVEFAVALQISNAHPLTRRELLLYERLVLALEQFVRVGTPVTRRRGSRKPATATDVTCPALPLVHVFLCSSESAAINTRIEGVFNIWIFKRARIDTYLVVPRGTSTDTLQMRRHLR